MISQNRCFDIKKSPWLCDITNMIFLISHKWFCDITKSARIFYKKKIDFMISKNRICDITKSWRFFWYQFFFFFIYHKIDFFYFVISKIDLLILNLILWYHHVGVFYCAYRSLRILSITTFNCQKPKAQALNKKLFVCCTPTYPLLTLLPQTFFGTSGKKYFGPIFIRKSRFSHYAAM